MFSKLAKIYLYTFFTLSLSCQVEVQRLDLRSSSIEVKEKLIFYQQEYHQKCKFEDYRKVSYSLAESKKLQDSLNIVKTTFRKKYKQMEKNNKCQR